MSKPADNIADVATIIASIERFGAMSWEEYRRHIEVHPEDSGDLELEPYRSLRIGRDAVTAFWRLARHRREVDPDKLAISLDELVRAVRDSFVMTFVREARPLETRWVDRMLNRAVRNVKRGHVSLTHYYPCVFLFHAHPDTFSIGPVRFTAKAKFMELYAEKIKADQLAADKRVEERLLGDVAQGRRLPLDENTPARDEVNAMVTDWIMGYFGSYAWVAEVSVPACHESISRSRAEATIQAALDVLKLFFGHHSGKDFRLGHQRGEPDKMAHLWKGDDGEFKWSISRSGEGGSAEEGWFSDIENQSAWALSAAGSAIVEHLRPAEVRSEHRDRWLGALAWYGQAISESAPAGQLVKYVAALERLTVLEESNTRGGRGVAEVVTCRTALLGAGSDDTASLAKALVEARLLYDWRSRLMHGRTSPLTEELQEVMHIAHALTQSAMFTALDLFVRLDTAGYGSAKELEALYLDLEGHLPKDVVA